MKTHNLEWGHANISGTLEFEILIARTNHDIMSGTVYFTLSTSQVL